MTSFNFLLKNQSNITSFPSITNYISCNKITKKSCNDTIKNILIIDDQEINVKICEKLILKNSNNSLIYKAYNGSEALTLVKKLKKQGIILDLIISDIQMPLMSGIKLVQEIRKFDNLTPIIAYTSRSSLNIKKLALKVGFDDYITKPASNDLFKKLTHKWLIHKNYNKNINHEKLVKSLSNKKIIIADDEPINLMILKRLFKRYNIKTEIVTNGIELIKKYKDQFKHPNKDNYDLIITDILMPELKGYDAAKIIREYEILNNIENRVIIIANSCLEELKEFNRALKNGVNDFFIKGRDNKILLNTIYNWLTLESNSVNKNSIKSLDTDHKECVKNLSILSNKIKKEDVSELKKEFKNSAKRLTESIIDNYKTNNLTKLSSNSHSLKGISGNIGAQKLFYIVNKINNLAKYGKKPSSLSIKNLQYILSQTLKYLEKNF